MAYKRQIAYWDLLENGEKKGNVGFCKWEQREETHTISISVRGLQGIKEECLGVYTKAGGALGELKLRNGKAEAVFYPHEQEVCRGLGRIWIPLSQGCELEACFGDVSREDEKARFLEEPRKDEKVRYLEETRKDENERYSEENRKDENERYLEEPRKDESVRFLEETRKGENVRLEGNLEDASKERYVQKITHEVETASEKIKLIAAEETLRIESEQKPKSLWENFAATNEKMRPFGTETEYYRIALEDIYRLNDECHMLRNNQFLLHGYYNYHYLILGKKETVEDTYWLGVPGIYHEREKMAARMYGFEKFEGTTRDYRVGDLGYYLISVR